MASSQRPQLKSAAGSYGKIPPCPLLAAYLDDDSQRAFIDSMAQVSVPKHEVIMRQGDKGNNFYVIKEGTAEVTLTDASGTKHVRTLSAGNSCGELSLLTGEPRSATVQATSDTLVLLMVNRRMFYARIGDAILRKRARWKDFIRDLPAIGDATGDYEHGQLADAVSVIELLDGAAVTKPMAPLAFYVVHEGRVTCPAAQRTFGRGDFFGHAEILQDKAGSQPVRRAEGGRAVLLTLTPAHFYQLVPLHVLVKDSHEQAQ